jgi:light-regulated signal transduction histidine kinase (bacteriophytochrome)
MERLIEDLLSYARLESQDRHFVPVDCAAVLDDVVQLLEGEIRDTRAEVTSSALPTVMGDQAQLVQLFQNLIGNGIKYHGTRPPRIHVSAQRQDGAWVFSVSDNGIGIEPEQHQRIFEIFRRLHTQSEYPGTGIGLAVCRRVVERHGGTLWVESEPGQGSTFLFTIPDRNEVTP